MPTLIQSAIDAALTQNWDQAISLNESIIKKNENDIEALSRLAYAYCQLGRFNQAKKIYRKILQLDKYNLIAQKNLEKIIDLTENRSTTLSQKKLVVSPSHFIEEPGKTKTVILKNIAPIKVLSKLSIGDPVVFQPKKHSIEVRTNNKIYLGALPDDLAFRLLRFLKAGNVYDVFIKNISKNLISVFVREVSRGKKLKYQPTFFTAYREYTASTLREMKRSYVNDEEEQINQNHEDFEE